MKLVITVPDYIKEQMDAGKSEEFGIPPWLGYEIVKGTPLPKGHGKLVDIGKIDKDRIESNNPIIYLTINGEYIEAISLDYLNSLPTIIEADKESEE